MFINGNMVASEKMNLYCCLPKLICDIFTSILQQATLPLAKLCALVTMQKRGEANVQTFTLPLSSIVISDQEDDHEAAAKVSVVADNKSKIIVLRRPLTSCHRYTCQCLLVKKNKSYLIFILPFVMMTVSVSC